MAYMSQEMKKKLAPAIKATFKKYGLKGSIGVNNHSTLVINIKAGKVDFLNEFRDSSGNKLPEDRHYLNVNPYWYKNHFDGDSYFALKEIIEAANEGNWDKSDIQSDYFNVGWYVEVNIGQWDKPYQVIES